MVKVSVATTNPTANMSALGLVLIEAAGIDRPAARQPVLDLQPAAALGANVEKAREDPTMPKAGGRRRGRGTGGAVEGQGVCSGG